MREQIAVDLWDHKVEVRGSMVQSGGLWEWEGSPDVYYFTEHSQHGSIMSTEPITGILDEGVYDVICHEAERLRNGQSGDSSVQDSPDGEGADDVLADWPGDVG